MYKDSGQGIYFIKNFIKILKTFYNKMKSTRNKNSLPIVIFIAIIVIIGL